MDKLKFLRERLKDIQEQAAKLRGDVGYVDAVRGAFTAIDNGVAEILDNINVTLGSCPLYDGGKSFDETFDELVTRGVL